MQKKNFNYTELNRNMVQQAIQDIAAIMIRKYFTAPNVEITNQNNSHKLPSEKPKKQSKISPK